jgi:hypothetical protein
VGLAVGGFRRGWGFAVGFTVGFAVAGISMWVGFDVRRFAVDGVSMWVGFRRGWGFAMGFTVGFAVGGFRRALWVRFAVGDAVGRS